MSVVADAKLTRSAVSVPFPTQAIAACTMPYPDSGSAKGRHLGQKQVSVDILFTKAILCHRS